MIFFIIKMIASFLPNLQALAHPKFRAHNPFPFLHSSVANWGRKLGCITKKGLDQKGKALQDLRTKFRRGVRFSQKEPKWDKTLFF